MGNTEYRTQNKTEYRRSTFAPCGGYGGPGQEERRKGRCSGTRSGPVVDPGRGSPGTARARPQPRVLRGLAHGQALTLRNAGRSEGAEDGTRSITDRMRGRSPKRGEGR